MIYHLLLSCALFYLNACFRFVSIPINKNCHALSMVHKPPIQILTTAGVEMTEPLKNHIKNKMGNVFDRMGKDVLSAHVTLKLNRHKSGEKHSILAKKGSQKAEVTVVLPGKTILHASDHCNSMERSVDKVTKKLARIMLKYREMHEENVHSNHIKHKEKETDFDDGDLTKKINIASSGIGESILRIKKFSMNPISVLEAAKAMDLIDHPFYTFRNIEDGKINVIYRRYNGGLGLIQPE